MKIYISGKISGLTTEEALNNFERAEKYLHENQNSLDSVYVNELVNK